MQQNVGDDGRNKANKTITACLGRWWYGVMYTYNSSCPLHSASSTINTTMLQMFWLVLEQISVRVKCLDNNNDHNQKIQLFSQMQHMKVSSACNLTLASL